MQFYFFDKIQPGDIFLRMSADIDDDNVTFGYLPSGSAQPERTFTLTKAEVLRSLGINTAILQGAETFPGVNASQRHVIMVLYADPNNQ
jgi:hypothetical protein